MVVRQEAVDLNLNNIKIERDELRKALNFHINAIGTLDLTRIQEIQLILDPDEDDVELMCFDTPHVPQMLTSSIKQEDFDRYAQSTSQTGQNDRDDSNGMRLHRITSIVVRTVRILLSF